MNNEQITSNLGELIKNQIEICEKLDKIGKQIKKIGKPKNQPYFLGDFITDKYFDPKFIDEQTSYTPKQFANAMNSLKFKQAGDKVVNEVETPKQNQKYYLCIKDYGGLVKNGAVLKAINESTFIKNNDIKDTVFLNFIESQSNIFIPIQQFETLKEGQEIEFTLRNGKTYKVKVMKTDPSLTTKDHDIYYLSCYDEPFNDLGQTQYRNKLNGIYSNTWDPPYPSAPTLEDLTKDLNTLITLPDISAKQPDQTESIQNAINEIKSFNDPIFSQANDLVDKFMPLVNGWSKKDKADRPLNAIIGNAFWSYSDLNQRKAAIKCAIVHCELMMSELIIDPKFHQWNDLKSELQKMLSE